MHAKRERRVRAHAGHDVRRVRVGFQRTLHARAPLQCDEGRGPDLRLPQCSLRLGGDEETPSSLSIRRLMHGILVHELGSAMDARACGFGFAS